VGRTAWWRLWTRSLARRGCAAPAGPGVLSATTIFPSLGSLGPVMGCLWWL
jgi:hypothetical protein